MSDALTTAVQGINESVVRATQSVDNIVNASSRGQNIDADLIAVKVASTQVDVNAAVIKIDQKMKDALIDMLV